MTEQVELIGEQREYVVIMDVGFGPFVWQNAVMYRKSAEKAYLRITRNHPFTPVRLCHLLEIAAQEAKDNG